jgi:hypothetical protein
MMAAFIASASNRSAEGAEAGLGLLNQPVVDFVVRQGVVVEDAAGGANGVGEEGGHHDVVHKASGQRHFIR